MVDDVVLATYGQQVTLTHIANSIVANVQRRIFAYNNRIGKWRIPGADETWGAVESYWGRK